MAMPQARIEPTADPAFLLACLQARAEARAWLWASHDIEDLHDAVDELWTWAERRGLVDFYGVDAVQAVLSTAFGAHHAA